MATSTPASKASEAVLQFVGVDPEIAASKRKKRDRAVCKVFGYL